MTYILGGLSGRNAAQEERARIEFPRSQEENAAMAAAKRGAAAHNFLTEADNEIRTAAAYVADAVEWATKRGSGTAPAVEAQQTAERAGLAIKTALEAVAAATLAAETARTSAKS